MTTSYWRLPPMVHVTQWPQRNLILANRQGSWTAPPTFSVRASATGHPLRIPCTYGSRTRAESDPTLLRRCWKTMATVGLDLRCAQLDLGIMVESIVSKAKCSQTASQPIPSTNQQFLCVALLTLAKSKHSSLSTLLEGRRRREG